MFFFFDPFIGCFLSVPSSFDGYLLFSVVVAVCLSFFPLPTLVLYCSLLSGFLSLLLVRNWSRFITNCIAVACCRDNYYAHNYDDNYQVNEAEHDNDRADEDVPLSGPHQLSTKTVARRRTDARQYLQPSPDQLTSSSPTQSKRQDTPCPFSFPLSRCPRKCVKVHFL